MLAELAQGLVVSNPADKAKLPSAKEAKAPEMPRWDNLRHTHDDPAGDGVAVKVVSGRLGHMSVTITLETRNVMPGIQSEAAARFAALVDGQP